MIAAKVLGCAVGGFILGGIGGVWVATTWIWPNSNLAGIVVYLTAPLGLVIGLVIGAVWASSSKK